jgi:tetratricopeptide (TPR) repeat protein
VTREGSSSFLKKRTKKLLRGWRRLVRDSRVKVFASFFKKKPFLAVLLLAAAAPRGTDELLAALAVAPNTQIATDLEQRLQQAWYDKATPAVQLLMDHAVASAHTGKMKDALADCDAAIVLQPELPDLWRRRAEVRFVMGDDKGAISDLAQALTREPKLVPAFADLSRYAEARNDNKRALAAWRKVLELDPKTEGGKARLERLQKKVSGEPI